MPFGDGTGPYHTGGGFGMGRGRGRGIGGGYGRGYSARGFGGYGVHDDYHHHYQHRYSDFDEKIYLENRKRFLEEELAMVKDALKKFISGNE